MIPGLKEQLVGLINEPGYVPLKMEELAKIFDIHTSERPMFYNFIEELEQEGYVVRTKKNKIMSAEQAGLFVGKFVAHEKGFGFIESDEEFVQDLFIPADYVETAMHGDRVVAEVIKEATDERRAEGKILRIVKREITEVVGTFQKCDARFAFVVPDSKRLTKDVYVPKSGFNGATTGDKVVCKITLYPRAGKKPEGVVTEVIGKKGDRYVEIDSIVRANNLPDDFPKKVQREAEQITAPTEADFEGRLDLRDWNIFTIDGDDAKDLDDAISIEKLKNGNYILGVHIADVSHYVTEGSKIDKEALKRATSVYLVDKVIPMLPKKLSNGICSLNAGEDRLALSCLMDIDKKGNVVGHKIAETVIHVTERMTYTNVNKILTHADEAVTKKYQELVPMFFLMKELSEIVRKNRKKRGAIDFDFPESKVILDENGKPVDIYEYEHNSATDLIEDFMLLANETVAEEYYFNEIPFVYRTHEEPDSEKIESVFSMIRAGKYKEYKA